MTGGSAQATQDHSAAVDGRSERHDRRSACVPRWVTGGRFTELIDDGDYDAQHVDVPAGFTTPLHRHTRYAEHFYAVTGSFEFWAGDDHRLIGPGESITIPIGTAHALLAGDGGGRGLIISRPAGFAKVIRHSGTETEDAFDLDVFVQAAVQAGDEILGPPGARPPIDK